MKNSSAVSIKKVSDLTPDRKNANRGTARGRAVIEKSLRDYGAGRSILLDKHGAIIAGNKTAENCAAAGLEDVLVVQSDGTKLIAVQRMDLDLNDPKARELAIADNRASELSLNWDLDVLHAGAAGVDLEQFWSEKELDALWPTKLLVDEDEAPPLPATPRTRPGDLYTLGKHRLLCGDATSLVDVRRLVGKETVDCVWTDPPYNVGYIGKTKAKLKIQNDAMTEAGFEEFLRLCFTAALEVLKKGGACYVAHADTAGEKFRQCFREAGFHLAGCLIWRKNVMVLGHSDYQWRHEPILYGWRPGKAHCWYGGRKQTTIAEYAGPAVQQLEDGAWQVGYGDNAVIIRGEKLTAELVTGDIFTEEKPSRNAEHPTMKPVALVERMVLNSTAPWGNVLDLFGGSGTTLIACEKTARRCFMMEFDPAYADVICERYLTATGKMPKREDGSPWK